jgi:hypothetical protein
MNQSTSTNSISDHYRNKIMSVAGYGFILLFVLLIVLKSLIPQGSGEWSDPPIYDYIILFGFGVCTAIMGIGYSYFAWTRGARDYVEWFLEQSARKTKWQIELMSSHPVYALWLARLIAPFIALFGIALIGYISYSVLMFILRL